MSSIRRVGYDHGSVRYSTSTLRHPHLDCSCPFFLLEVDVAHVHAESPAEGVLLVFHDLGVDRQGLRKSITSSADDFEHYKNEQAEPTSWGRIL